jgi:hypothetical protein
MRDTIRPEKSKRWHGRALLGIARETSLTPGSRDHRVCAQRARLRIPIAVDRALPSPSEWLLLAPSILRAERTRPPREQPLGRGAVAERGLESASQKGQRAPWVVHSPAAHGALRAYSPNANREKDDYRSDQTDRPSPPIHFAVANATLVTPASLQIFNTLTMFL